MCDGMDINYQTRTRMLYMHTTLYTYLCVQFLQPAAYVLPICIRLTVKCLPCNSTTY